MSARSFTLRRQPRPKEISFAGWFLLCMIADHHHEELHCAFFSKAYAARLMATDVKYVQDLIWELEDRGYLRVYERPGTRNRYVVPPLRGEHLAQDFVMHEGPTWTDPESKKVWHLRQHPCRDGSHIDPEERAWRDDIRKRQAGAMDLLRQVPPRSQTRKRKAK